MSNLKAILKEQVLDLKKILNNVNSFSKYPKLLQSMLKKVSVVWSQDDDTRRVFALLILMKSIKKNPDYFGICSKGMYLVYVKNSKFIYGCNIGKNNFMRNGLLELYSLQLDEAYKHAFIFIRQLAITVRKAYLRTNKEDSQAVYNWQFICSLRFWTEFVARNSASHDLVRTLIHPLVQVILGTVRLNPGSRWIPLRFHCIEFLHLLAGINLLRSSLSDEVVSEFSPPNHVQSAARTLVPSLPLLLDVFRIVDFNRRSSTASKAPMDLRLLLHFSPSQCQETAFLDSVCAWLHDLLTDSLTIYAYSVAFPEYCTSAVTEIRAFIKTCNVANFSRDFKLLLNKVKAHSEFVQKKRAVIKSLLDVNAVTNIEESIRHSSSPMIDYYGMHRKQRVLELTRLADRFKNEGKIQDTVPDEDIDEHFESKPQKAKKSKKLVQDKSDQDSESDTSSDGSYEYDDGKTVTRVARTNLPKKSKQNKKLEESDADGDSDLDLQEALEVDDEDAVSSHSEDDELTDFNLDDSDSDADKNHDDRRKKRLRDPDLEGEGLDIDSFASSNDESGVADHPLQKKAKSRRKKSSSNKVKKNVGDAAKLSIRHNK